MILNISSCNDPGLGFILKIIRTLFTIIEVVSPIVLIISLLILFTKLLANPEDKKLLNNIKNSIISCIIIFLIPALVNLTMNILGEKYTFSECWNSSYSSTGTGRYIEKEKSKDKKSTKVVIDPSTYHGKTTSKTTDNKTSYNNNSLGNAIIPGNVYGGAIATKALYLSASAIGTNYLTASDAAKVGCSLSGDGRLHVPAVDKSYKYRAELPQTEHIIKFWDEERAANKGGIGFYGPASCSPWIASVLRSMGYDNNVGTAVASREAPESPWTHERITNSISAHGIGAYMYHHPENFEKVNVSSNRPIKEQCIAGDILVCSTHIMIYVGNELANLYFPGTTGNMVEAAELGRCYPGVTASGNGNVGGYMVFRVKHPATNLS